FEVRLMREGGELTSPREIWRVEIPFDPAKLVPEPAAVEDDRLATAIRTHVLAVFSPEAFYDRRPLVWIETDAHLGGGVDGCTDVTEFLVRRGCILGRGLGVPRGPRPVARGVGVGPPPLGPGSQSSPGGQLLEWARGAPGLTDGDPADAEWS